MRKIPWLKIGAVAALWTIVAGAAVSGWMIGKSDAAREYSDLQRRLTAGTSASRSCGIEVELLEVPGREIAPPEYRAELGPTQIFAPAYLNLREMLTSR